MDNRLLHWHSRPWVSSFVLTDYYFKKYHENHKKKVYSILRLARFHCKSSGLKENEKENEKSIILSYFHMHWLRWHHDIKLCIILLTDDTLWVERLRFSMVSSLTETTLPFDVSWKKKLFRRKTAKGYQTFSHFFLQQTVHILNLKYQ